MVTPHAWHKRRLMLLLPLLAATEFVENSAFTFSASQISRGLKASPLQFALLLAAFASGTMLMIALGQLLSRHWGFRRYLLLSLGLMLVGAAGSSMTAHWSALLLWRALEGFGSGALFTSSRILVVQLLAREDRPAALRTYISGLFGITASGPLLAAFWFAQAGWNATFLAPIPYALLAWLGVYRWLPAELGRHQQAVRWSVRPIVGFAAAVGLLQISLASIRVDARLHPLALALLAIVGAGLLWFWTLRQRHHVEPLVHWHALRNPGYLTGIALYSLYYLLSNASNYLFPVFTEHALGLPFTTIGGLSSGSAAITWLSALLYLRWARHLPPKHWLMAGSCGLLLLSCLWFAHTPGNAGAGYLLPGVLAKGMFGALLVLPLAGFTFRELADDHFGSAYQNKNLIRQLAIALGTAVSAAGVAGLQAGDTGMAAPVALQAALADMYRILALACGCMLILVLVLIRQKKLH